MTKWSWVLALCLSLPISSQAEEKEKKAPKKAKPFRKADFSVHGAQALNKNTFAFFGELGYPFVKTGFIYGLGGFANVGLNLRTEWALTVGGDAHVQATLYKTKIQALALKVEGGLLTRAAGDPQVLAFGPGGAGVGDGTKGGLPHAFSATTHLNVTPQLVWSYKDTVGTWFLSGGATLQNFLDEPLDLPASLAAPKMAFMPRVSVGIEQLMGGQMSFHMEAVGGVYVDPNAPDINGNPDISAIVMAQIGLNLYLP